MVTGKDRKVYKDMKIEKLTDRQTLSFSQHASQHQIIVLMNKLNELIEVVNSLQEERKDD